MNSILQMDRTEELIFALVAIDQGGDPSCHDLPGHLCFDGLGTSDRMNEGPLADLVQDILEHSEAIAAWEDGLCAWEFVSRYGTGDEARTWESAADIAEEHAVMRDIAARRILAMNDAENAVWA